MWADLCVPIYVDRFMCADLCGQIYVGRFMWADLCGPICVGRFVWADDTNKQTIYAKDGKFCGLVIVFILWLSYSLHFCPI